MIKDLNNNTCYDHYVIIHKGILPGMAKPDYAWLDVITLPHLYTFINNNSSCVGYTQQQGLQNWAITHLLSTAQGDLDYPSIKWLIPPNRPCLTLVIGRKPVFSPCNGRWQTYCYDGWLFFPVCSVALLALLAGPLSSCQISLKNSSAGNKVGRPWWKLCLALWNLVEPCRYRKDMCNGSYGWQPVGPPCHTDNTVTCELIDILKLSGGVIKACRQRLPMAKQTQRFLTVPEDRDSNCDQSLSQGWQTTKSRALSSKTKKREPVAPVSEHIKKWAINSWCTVDTSTMRMTLRRKNW